MSETDKNIDDAQPRFREHQHLAPFLAYLDPMRVHLAPGESVRGYISQYRLPADKYDMLPRARRDTDTYQPNDRPPRTPQAVADMTDAKRNKAIGSLGQSCNATEELGIKSRIESFQLFLKKDPTDDEKDAHMRNRGIYLVPVVISEQNAWITPFDGPKLHANIYLKEGYTYEDIRDKSQPDIDLLDHLEPYDPDYIGRYRQRRDDTTPN